MDGKLGKILSANFGFGGGGADKQLGVNIRIGFDGYETSLFLDDFNDITQRLVDAKATRIDQLIGKPIVVTSDDGFVRNIDWRILKEVL